MAEKEQEYYVSVRVDGRIDVCVTAASFEQAKERAEMEVGNTDWNCMECIATEAVNAEREDGVFKDY